MTTQTRFEMTQDRLMEVKKKQETSMAEAKENLLLWTSKRNAARAKAQEEERQLRATNLRWYEKNWRQVWHETSMLDLEVSRWQSILGRLEKDAI